MKSSIYFVFIMIPVLVQARERYSYEPAVVNLKGIVAKKVFYGPPQWGEDPAHDRKETQFVLDLQSAIDVRGDGKDPLSPTETNVREITLTGTELTKIPAVKFLGKKMMFEGSLFHSQVGHHHTDVLMTVTCVKSRKLAPCLTGDQ